MTKITQTMLLATGIVFVVGAVTWVALGGLKNRPEEAPRGNPDSEESVEPGAGDGHTPGVATVPIGTTDPAYPKSPEPGEPSGVVKPGLRAPSGEDLSNPAAVQKKLREILAQEDPRWDWVADLLSVLSAPLDADIKKSIEKALVEGNAAGALQAYEKIRDPSVVGELLRLLDDPTTDLHDRTNVLRALTMTPGGDPGEVVKGIEARLSGDAKEDRPYLQAIARKGGAEAARALVDFLSRAKELGALDPEIWRELILTTDPAAAEYLAFALRDTTRSPQALMWIADMAGRAGGGPAVEALVALTADTQPDPLRRQALTSLGRTGDPKAVAALLAMAEKGSDYGSVAARALSEVTSASPEVRARLLEAASTTKDEFLRGNLIHTLGTLKSADALPLLTESLTSSSEPVRLEAATSIGSIGPAAASAIDPLVKAFMSGGDGMKSAAIVSLLTIGTPEALSALKQLAAAPNLSPLVQKNIATALRVFEARTR